MMELYLKLRELGEIPEERRRAKGVFGISVNISESGEEMIVETPSGKKIYTTPESIINFINSLKD